MKFFLKFVTFSLFLWIGFYIFILSVDPYNKYGFNFWNLKTKATGSYRDNKFYQIDNSPEEYELFILGSSRAQGFNPETIKAYTGLKTFNYGVNNSKPEDILAITKHIISAQNPKSIFIQLDFYNLNKHIPIEFRLKKSPLVKFLDEDTKKKIDKKNINLYENNYAALTALIDSIKTIYKNKFGTIEISHKKNGMKIGNLPEKNPKLAIAYFKNEYKNYEFDTQRISHYKDVKNLCDKNNIKLVVSISPMNKEHFLKITQDKYLFEKLLEFKKIVVSIFENVYDFNNLAVFNYDYPYWVDSIHPSIELSGVMTNIIFNNKFIGEAPKDFGVLVTKQNIDEHLQNLREQIEFYDLNKSLKSVE